MDMNRIFSHAEVLDVQLDRSRQALAEASNWSQKVAIISALVCGSKVDQNTKLQVKHAMMFEMLPRVSNAEYRMLICQYNEDRARVMLQELETNDVYDIHDNTTRHLCFDEQTFTVTDIVRNIQAKEAIFNIYQRYGHKILSNMLIACDKNVFFEFLSAFCEFNFTRESIDLEVLETFAFRLSTF